MKIKKILLASSIVVIVFIGTACQYGANPNNIGAKNVGSEKEISSLPSEIINNPDNSQSNSSPSSFIEKNELKTTNSTDDSSKGIDENRIIEIDSGLDFPPYDLTLVNDEVFEILRGVYKETNFEGEFKKGNVDEYDFYMKKFRRLLKNEVTFLEPHTGMEFYLNQYDGTYLNESGELTASISLGNGIGNLDEAVYYFFDMDECGAPELCIDVGATYIFKYILDSEKIVLWYETNTMYALLGSKKVCYVNLGVGITNVFYILDDNGKEKYILHFFEQEYRNKKTGQYEDIFMASLPQYPDKSKAVRITKEIQNQGYVDKWNRSYYFRVTEEQYNELTKDYYQSEELARERIKDVSFTYEDLVGASK